MMWLRLGIVSACAIIASCMPEPSLEEMVIRVFLPQENILATTGTFNLACDNTYGTGATGDWTQNNIVVASGGGITTPKKNCRLTLTQYFDGTNTFTPVSTSLVISVSSTGVITTTSALQYTNGAGNLQWFLAAQNGAAYNLAISYASNAITATQSITPTILTTQTYTVSIAQAAVAPSVTLITVTQISLLGILNYTLTAVVTGSSACKYIDNTAGTYNPSNWISVNSAYNNASAVTCPVIIPGSPLLVLGNWTTAFKTGKTNLVIWSKTSPSGVNAYTTSNIVGQG